MVTKTQTPVTTKFLPNAVIAGEQAKPRQIRVIVSNATRDRAKDIMIASGCDLTNYRKNPIVLLNHDPKKPIARAFAEIKSDRVEALITFPPEGEVECADETFALIKNGVLNTVSAGFGIREKTALKDGGYKITKWELMEISIVSIPANTDAIITERSIDEDSEHRRRELELLEMKYPPHQLTQSVKTTTRRAPACSDDPKVREAELAALRAVHKSPTGLPSDPASYAAEMTKRMISESRARSSRLYKP